jgi:MFS family permease
MLDFKLFQNGAFSLGALAAVTLFTGMSATRFLTPFFLQGVKGYDATSVGAFMLPAAIVTAICAPFAGRLADRFGVRLFANIGFGFTIIGLIVFSTIHTSTPTSTVVAGLMVLAFGMAIFGAPNSAAVLNSVPAEAYGIASGFVNLCRNSGNVIGVAFGTAIVTLTMGAAGYAPSLTEVTTTAEAGLFVAFTEGVRSTCYVLIALAVPVLVIVVAWSIRTHRRRHTKQDQSANE